MKKKILSALLATLMLATMLSGCGGKKDDSTSSNGGNGTRSKNAVSTADNSPIGTMSALAVASLLAGGYVIVRRRKKDI